MESEAPRLIRSRVTARQVCFQLVYALDTPGVVLDEVLEALPEQFTFERGLEKFVDEVVRGVQDQREDLDSLIRPLLRKGWELDRIAKTDRAALRLATYELLNLNGVPPKVTINEAVNLAKTYGNTESGRFVNGLLGKLLLRTSKAEWDPSQEEIEPPLDEPAYPEPAPEETIEEGSDAHKEMLAAGRWLIKND